MSTFSPPSSALPSSVVVLRPGRSHQPLDQRFTLIVTIPVGFTHRPSFALLAVITPLLVLVNCLDKIQTAFITTPVQPISAAMQPPVSGLDYLDNHAEVLWTYAQLGHSIEPSLCQPAGYQ
ncbi:MAG: hypothetical protein AAFW95_14715 [Cyanobacteria bacterium J06638_6]